MPSLFFFDQNFADASYSIGLQYYPKLLLGVPFTPASGRRVLTVSDDKRDELLRVFARAVMQLCGSMRLGSAHMNFCEADEAAAFAGSGYFHRLGIQWHWRNEDYADFDEFLTRKFKSKRRINLKRERRKVFEKGVTIEVVAGEDISPSDIVDIGYTCYVAGISKQWLYGRRCVCSFKVLLFLSFSPS